MTLRRRWENKNETVAQEKRCTSGCGKKGKTKMNTWWDNLQDCPICINRNMVISRQHKEKEDAGENRENL